MFKTKSIINISLITVLFVTAVFVLPKPAHATEDGTSEGTAWLVNNCTELQAIGSGVGGWDLDSFYKLNGTVDCTGVDFQPIGVHPGSPFTGALDGNAHSITHLVINKTGTDYVGLFAEIDGGTVKNLTLASGSVTSDGSYVGSIVGYVNNDITLDNIVSRLPITVTSASDTNYIGGLVGGQDSGTLTITNSHYTADLNITGASIQDLGGLAGYSYLTVITNSYFQGNITAVGSAISEVGGLDASVEGITLSDSHVIGNIDVTSTTTDVAYISGLVGFVDETTPLTIDSSYMEGNITVHAETRARYIGGVLGLHYRPLDITGSHYSGDINVTAGTYIQYVAGLVGRYYYAGHIDQSYSTGSITLNSVDQIEGGVGGLVGNADDVTSITDSYSTMDIDITAGYVNDVGGLIGLWDWDTLNISNSYATGDVTIHSTAAVDSVAGLIGSADSTTSTIINSFSTGLISVTSGTDTVNTVGGFIGEYSGSLTLTNDYYDQTLSAQAFCTGQDNPDPSGCTAKTDSTFFKNHTNGALFSEWDFPTTWNVDGTNNDSYPYLAYQSFPVTTHTLTISTFGNGTGVVTSDPAGISCGVTCSSAFDDGTTVTLSATADSGSDFAGWSGGGCSGGSTCIVTLSDDTSVSASFALTSSGGGGADTGAVVLPGFTTTSTASPSPSPTPTTTPPSTPTPPPSLVLDQGTIYLIVDGTKQPFSSMDVFLGLGYNLNQVTTGDTSNIPKGSDILDTNHRHPKGSLVLINGTVFLLGDTQRFGFPTEDIFKSYGYTFNQVIPANSFDLQIPEGDVMKGK